MSLALTPSQDAVRCEFLAFLLVGMGLRLFLKLNCRSDSLKGSRSHGALSLHRLSPPSSAVSCSRLRAQAASAHLPCPPRSVGESRALAALTGTQSRL